MAVPAVAEQAEHGLLPAWGGSRCWGPVGCGAWAQGWREGSGAGRAPCRKEEDPICANLSNSSSFQLAVETWCLETVDLRCFSPKYSGACCEDYWGASASQRPRGGEVPRRAVLPPYQPRDTGNLIGNTGDLEYWSVLIPLTKQDSFFQENTELLLSQDKTSYQQNERVISQQAGSLHCRAGFLYLCSVFVLCLAVLVF